MPTISLFYAGLLGLIALGVAMPAGRTRAQHNVSVGDGGHPDLLLAMRRHANFAEWVPIAIILIALLELNHVRPPAIHVLGAVLVIARLCHAFGLKGETMRSTGRFVGAIGTVLVVAVASVWAIVCFVKHQSG